MSVTGRARDDPVECGWDAPEKLGWTDCVSKIICVMPSCSNPAEQIPQSKHVRLRWWL